VNQRLGKLVSSNGCEGQQAPKYKKWFKTISLSARSGVGRERGERELESQSSAGDEKGTDLPFYRGEEGGERAPRGEEGASAVINGHNGVRFSNNGERKCGEGKR
jgi:hypothetical protein